MTDERELLEMALIGYAMKREQIEREQERVRLLLHVATTDKPLHPVFQNQLNRMKAQAVASKPRRHFSAEARARIVAATKARWARYRREKARKGGRK